MLLTMIDMILRGGIRGDHNSDKEADGTFYEDAITRGYSTDKADDASIQASIVAADYDR